MPPKRKLAAATALTAKPPAEAAGAGKKGQSKKTYGKAPELPAGEILTDYSKRQWKLGNVIGVGGFGRIYLASKTDEKNAGYVVKMEPADNGPLFQETHFYQRVGKTEMLRDWKTQKGLKFLGIPTFVAAGNHVKNGTQFRFLVLPRLGVDLESYRRTSESNVGGRLEPAFVFRLAACCLDSLEYLHCSAQYVHADLKGENLLAASADSKKSAAASKNAEEYFLVDYGLARKVADKPVYKEAPRKAHDGTLIFTSLDAHRGVTPCYRGDVEILGYNIIFWLTGTLPWMDVQNNPEKVFEAKEAFSKNVQDGISSKLPSIKELVKFFRHVYSLEYDARPDFDHLRSLMREAANGSAKQQRPTTTTAAATNGGTSSKTTTTTAAAASPGKKTREMPNKKNPQTPGGKSILLRNFVNDDDDDHSTNSSLISSDDREQQQQQAGSAASAKRSNNAFSSCLSRPGIKDNNNKKTTTGIVLAENTPSPSTSSKTPNKFPSSSPRKMQSPRSIVPGKANLRRLNGTSVAAADAKRRSSILVKRKYLAPKKPTAPTTGGGGMALRKRRANVHRIDSSDEDGQE